jgi:hypothetical protein
MSMMECREEVEVNELPAALASKPVVGSSWLRDLSGSGLRGGGRIRSRFLWFRPDLKLRSPARCGQVERNQTQGGGGKRTLCEGSLN